MLFKPQSFNRIYILHPLLRPLPSSPLPFSLCRSAVPPTGALLLYLGPCPLQTFSEEQHVCRGAPDLSMESPREADPEDLLHEIMHPCIPDNPSMMQGSFPSIHLRHLLQIRIGTTTCPFYRSTQNLMTWDSHLAAHSIGPVADLHRRYLHETDDGLSPSQRVSLLYGSLLQPSNIRDRGVNL
jgi:hypothetical protein